LEREVERAEGVLRQHALASICFEVRAMEDIGVLSHVVSDLLGLTLGGLFFFGPCGGAAVHLGLVKVKRETYLPFFYHIQPFFNYLLLPKFRLLLHEVSLVKNILFRKDIF
jgi:hypothetical protein